MLNIKVESPKLIPMVNNTANLASIFKNHSDATIIENEKEIIDDYINKKIKTRILAKKYRVSEQALRTFLRKRNILRIGGHIVNHSPTTDMVWCNGCKQYIPKSEFPQSIVEIIEYGSRSTSKCNQCRALLRKNYHKSVLSKICDDKKHSLSCFNCGESDIYLLQINHKNGNGNYEIRGDPYRFYMDIVNGIRNTADLDVLCANCNITYEFEMHNRDANSWGFKHHLKAMQKIVDFHKKELTCEKCGTTDVRVLSINHTIGIGRKDVAEYGTHTDFYNAIINGQRNVNDLNIICHNCQYLYEIEKKIE